MKGYAPLSADNFGDKPFIQWIKVLDYDCGVFFQRH